MTQPLKVFAVDDDPLVLDRVGSQVFQPLINGNVAQLNGLFKQPGPEPGMGDGDQGNGAFTNRLAEQISHTVFGDDIVNIRPRNRYAFPRPARVAGCAKCPRHRSLKSDR